MKISIICLGKSKKKYVELGINEYLKRIPKFYNLKIIEIPDIKLTKTNSIEIVKKKEAEIISKHLHKDDFIIALDETGKQFTSVKFSSYFDKLSSKNIVFIIGGVYGLDTEIKKKANLILSFSKFTFTHQMIRFLLIEQIYRAFTIINNKKYHY
jgi:23S rRNA (pseudouridine1915-N3)-methyltransferase